LGLRFNGYEIVLFAAPPGTPSQGELLAAPWPR
jgi:hypothetical protein